jgi:hypothetical protein
VCDILLRAAPRRLRAAEPHFSHATAGEAETLRSFALLVAARAAHAQRDAGLDRSVKLNQSACLRFASMEQFEAYQRWMVLCAAAAKG